MRNFKFKNMKEKEAFIEAVESCKIEGFTFNKKELKAVKDLHDGNIQIEDVIKLVKSGELKDDKSQS